MLWKMGLVPRYSSVLPCSIFTDLRIIGPYRATPASARRPPVEGLTGLFWQATFLPICSLPRAELIKNDSEFNGAAAFRFKLTSKVLD